MRGYEIDQVSVSRREEQHPQGWLGVERSDPGAISDRGWHQPDDPTDAEDAEQ